MAITNIQMTEETFDELITRTREIDIHLRLTVYTKLIKEKISLENRDLSSIYKIAYDGLYSRDEAIKTECVNYLRHNYYKFQDPTKSIAPLPQIEEELTANEKKKRFSSPRKLEVVSETRKRIVEFFGLFNVENTLLYPSLYQMMELLAKEFLERIVQPEDFSMYLRELLIYDLQFKSKGDHTITNEEIFLLRYLAGMYMYQEEADERKDLEEYFLILDESFPNGCQFVKVLEHFHQNSNLFGFYQSLLLAEMLINCDETGRNDLLNVLKRLCLDLKNFLMPLPSFPPPARSNDLFFPLNSETLNNQMFSRSYFEIIIVREFEDLVPLMIQIFRKLIGDQNNMFSIQIIELISEIREPLHIYAESNENEDNMQNRLLRMQKDLTQNDVKLEDVDNKLKELKRIKRKPDREQQDLMEKKNFLERQRDELGKNRDELENTIDSMNYRCLQICLGLLQRCRLNVKDPGLSNLLTSFIGPMFKDNKQRIMEKALHCLALWAFHDKAQCLEYFPVFTNVFEEATIVTKPTTIVSLKFVFDFLMVYEYPKVEGTDHLNLIFDLEDLLSLLSKFMFKGDVLIQKLCIEGFCRLLFNDRLQETEKTLANLMIVWFNGLLLKKGGFEAIQILSTFFRNYPVSSLSHLSNFEKALEAVINLIISMIQKQSEFNMEYIYYDFQELTTLHSMLKVGIDLMSNTHNRENKNLKEFEESGQHFSPQERFFVFLCKALSSKPNSRVVSLFEKTFSYFDFINNLRNRIEATILRKYLEQSFEKITDLQQNKILAKIAKKLEGFQGDAEENDKELDEVGITAVVQEMEANLRDNRGITNKYFHDLQDYELIVKRSDNPEGENEGTEGLEHNLEELDIGSRADDDGISVGKSSANQKDKKKGRGKKTTKINLDDEEIEDEEEEVKPKKNNKRKSMEEESEPKKTNKRKLEDIEKENNGEEVVRRSTRNKKK